MPQIVIISAQRSGTNFLRSILAKTLKVIDLDEALVLSSDAKPSGLYWFLKNTSRPYPTPESWKDCRTFYDDYFSWVRKFHGNKFLVDLKYNVVHTGLPTSFSIFEPSPVLLGLMNVDTVFIHLVRKNSLDVTISSQLAMESGIYHSIRGAEVDFSRLVKPNIDVKGLIRGIESHQILIQLFRIIVSSLGITIELDYDELTSFDPDVALAPLKDLVEQTWKIEIDQWSSSDLVRVGPPWWHRIGNTNEVISAILEDGRFINLLPDFSKSETEGG